MIIIIRNLNKKMIKITIISEYIQQYHNGISNSKNNYLSNKQFVILNFLTKIFNNDSYYK